MATDKAAFAIERLDNVLIVIPQGNMAEFRDSEIRDAYNDTYRMICDRSISHLLLDFGELGYFGSTFVGMLIRLARKTRLDGGEAVLCNLSEHMQGMMKTLMLLENTKTDFLWVPFETRSEAIGFLQRHSEVS